MFLSVEGSVYINNICYICSILVVVVVFDVVFDVVVVVAVFDDVVVTCFMVLAVVNHIFFLPRIKRTENQRRRR